MKFDYTELRKLIVNKFDTISGFAEYIEKPLSIVSMKLSGIRGFTKEDIINWCNALGIAKEDIGLYFFTLKV